MELLSPAPVFQSGISRPSTGLYGPRGRSSSDSPVRNSAISASVSGRNGTAGPVVLLRPRSTPIPAPTALPTTSAASRDLPTPASPTRNTTPPRPC